MAKPYRNKLYKKIRVGSPTRNPEQIRVLSPSRGMNELGDDFMIDNKDASDLLNIKFTDNGIVEKRDGFIIEGDELENIPTGLGVYVAPDDNDALMVVDGGVLKRLIDQTWTDVGNDKDITADSSVFTTSVNGKFFVWDGIGIAPNGNDGAKFWSVSAATANISAVAGSAVGDYFVNAGSGALTILGVASVPVGGTVKSTSATAGTLQTDANMGGGCIIYDGTTTTAGRKCPKGKFSVVYKDFHFVSGVDGQPYRVYVSGLNEPDRFTRLATNNDSPIQLNQGNDIPGATLFTGDNSPNAFDVNRYDGEKVTGFGFFQDALIIFKENSIWQMTLNEESLPVVSRITNAYGCVAHGSITTVENDCYFLGREGVMVLGNEPNYYAAIRTNILSARIQNTVERINSAAYDKVRSYFFNQRYHLAVPLDTEVNNNTMLVYDKRFYAWSVWDIPASGLSSYLDTANKRQFVFTNSQNNALNRFTPGIYNDNGAGIRAWWRSRAFHGRYIDFVKWWRQFRPIFKGLNGSIVISMYDEDGEFDASDEYTISPPLTGGLGMNMFGEQIYGGGTAEDYFGQSSGGSSSGSGTAGHHVSNTNNSKPLFIYINHKSRTFSFQIENSKPDENFSLLGFVIQFETGDFGNTDGSLTYLR